MKQHHPERDAFMNNPAPAISPPPESAIASRRIRLSLIGARGGATHPAGEYFFGVMARSARTTSDLRIVEAEGID